MSAITWKNIKPLHDFVLIVDENGPRFSQHGIELPPSSIPRQARVLRVGKDAGDDLEVGALVIVCEFAGIEVRTAGGILFTLIRRKDIEAVIDFDTPSEDPNGSLVARLREEIGT